MYKSEHRISEPPDREVRESVVRFMYGVFLFVLFCYFLDTQHPREDPVMTKGTKKPNLQTAETANA